VPVEALASPQVALQPFLKGCPGRARVDVISLPEGDPSEAAHVDAAASRHFQDQQVRALVPRLSLDEAPGNVQVADTRPQAQVFPPLDADRFHEKVVLHVQKCPRKGKIRVEVRHEGVGLRRVDEEDHPARRPLPCMDGKLLEVFSAALRDGVGEHGDASVEKRAGLDLEEKIPPAPRKEEVITARPGGSLAADDPVLLEPGEPSRCEQAGRHVVGEVRVQQDGTPFPLDGKRRVRDALARPGRIFHEIEEPPRKQQLPEPAGVGQVGLDGLSAQAAEDDKAVGPTDEPGPQEGRCERNAVERREGVHGITRPDGC